MIRDICILKDSPASPHYKLVPVHPGRYGAGEQFAELAEESSEQLASACRRVRLAT